MMRSFFTLRRRMNLPLFWLYILVSIAITGSLLIYGFADLMAYGSKSTIWTYAFAWVPFYIWINIVCGARRLHDFDRSAWWLILVFAFKVCAYIIATWLMENKFDTWGALAIWIAVFSMLVTLGFVPGSKGDNNYGPKPRAFWRRSRASD